ncbi:MAG: serine/threonine protein kinase [Phycisphaerae bacterium]|nr:serine/threonine protein kinase [Phycisphaerae bacterium]
MSGDPPTRPTEPLDPGSDPRQLQEQFLRERTNPPEQIGPYRILQVIGEGGMGVVYLAEQDKPIHRRVALKIIKLGMDSKQVVARFETEREALALMDHPNVARVLDAGVSDEGRPYFAMEYVPGIPITEYCDKHRLGTEDRLRLFADVCHAIQHAHQKGIIHRDIKPSNVIVAIAEDRPVPKVIDFGVAKATQRRLTELTLFTEQGQLIGTPGYMSPEQAEMTALDIDTRTDIYSLGVLLYELLVGVRPFDDDSLRAAGFAEIQRIIREVEPPKPSTRLSSLGDASTTVAQNRGTEVRILSRQLRGDLDWIVMKCLEKDRTRRYDTASAVAMEIQRFLNFEPVLAGPPSYSYRLRKFVRKNWGPVLAGVAVGLALAIGLASTIVMADRANRARAKAEAAAEDASLQRAIALEQRDRAQREADAAKQVTDFLVDVFEVSSPKKAMGETITAREILDRGAARVEEKLAGQPLIRARLLRTIGAIYRNLGFLEQARKLGEAALNTMEKAEGADALELAETRYTLAVTLINLGDEAMAERLLRAALDAHLDQSPRAVRATIAWRAALADVLMRSRRLEEAREVVETAMRDLSTNSVNADDALVELQLNLAEAYRREGSANEAERWFRSALERAREQYGQEHYGAAIVEHYLANALVSLSEEGDAVRLEEAKRLLLHVITVYRKVLPEEHQRTASALSGLGSLYLWLGELDEAQKYFEESLAMRRKILGPDHSDIAGDLTSLGAVFRLKKDYAVSAEYLQQAVAMRLRLLGKDDFRVGRSRSNLGETLMLKGDLGAAEDELLEAQRIFDAKPDASRDRSPDNIKCLIRLYEKLGRDEEAKRWAARLASSSQN